MKNLLILFFSLTFIWSLGCGGGTTAPGATGGDGTVNSDLKVLASNIVLSSALAAGLSAQTVEDVDSETLILAENVILDTEAKNALASENLQDALNNEIAVDLSSIIPGVWNVTNVEDTSLSPNLKNCTTDNSDFNPQGQIAFASNGSYSLCSGRFAMAGVEENDSQYSVAGYQVIDSGTITLTVDNSCPGVPELASLTGVTIITALETDSITMVTSGRQIGTGSSRMRYSKLTRVSSNETCP